MKRLKKEPITISLFSEKALVILVSIVTLLLQLISFATTWSGSRIYLADIFPYAALFFAISIQATAYFFSNSLRSKIAPLKVIALCVAICCSTYYSYIGIYNSVNSPATYLQESYVRISQELTQLYNEEMESTVASAREEINRASSLITSEYTSLMERKQTLEECVAALGELQASNSSGLRAPRLAAYENYEDYAAAYEAYINSLSQVNSTETESARQLTLSYYGFHTIEDLNTARQTNEASLSALNAALGIPFTESNEEIDTGASTVTPPTVVSQLSLQLSTAISGVTGGSPLGEEDIAAFNQLFQAAKLCGYDSLSLSQLTSSLNQCAQVSATALMADHSLLVAALPGGLISDQSMMSLKSSMDGEIMNALIKINSLLSDKEQLSYTESAYQITDLYLLPVEALRAPATRMTAFFCLGVAALIDLLSVLFATSLRKEKPIWKRNLLWGHPMEKYEPLIYASLPATDAPAQALKEFLEHFGPSPQTEADGYMLCTEAKGLSNYHALAALLCQVNLAKMVPAGFINNDSDVLLLKARFVFWANSMIYEERGSL